MDTILAPNEEYLEMTFTKETATGKGLNNQFIMENLHDGTFKRTEGRIGITIGINKPKSFIRPMDEWHALYAHQISLGYTLISERKRETKSITKKSASIGGNNYKPLDNINITNIIQKLINFTNQLMETQYTVKVEDITPEMLSRGKDILDYLADNYKEMSIAEFNNKLKTLYAVIPRRIDNLSKKLAKRTADFNDIIAAEQELYDIMQSQTIEHEVTTQKTILESYNLEWREVTEEEKEYLIKKMGCEGKRYRNAWRITNNVTEERFNQYCKKENLTDDNGITRLFHGSRSENFWSIITNGLTINPKGVVITGKMFGNGTYFAPDACKSMGYTSRSGSIYANGNQNTGFLGVYKVATGKAAEPRCVSRYSYQTLHKDGYHCVWCKRGGQIGLRMDEVVVYQDCQDTIEYLIEVGMN